MKTRNLKLILFTGLIVLAAVAWFASDQPDVLERALETANSGEQGFSLFGAYHLPGLGDGFLNSFLTAILGVSVVGGIIYGVLKVLVGHK